MALMWNVIFTLLVLIILNLGLKAMAPRWAFTQAEFICVYAMLTVASALAGHDTLQLHFPALSMPWYVNNVNPERNWSSMFLRYVPKWLTVSDMSVIKSLYEGHSTLYTKAKLLAWAGPILWWTLFIFVLGGVFLCMNVLVRKQWTEHEKLAFPIIQLPMAITEGGGTSEFFRNRFLWIGIAFGGGLDLINGLSVFYPSIPHFGVGIWDHELSQYFVTQPWKSMGWTPIPLYPFLIALGFLLPLDLAFSIWFFFIFRQGLRVLMAAYGWNAIPGTPYTNEQSFGAWFALIFFALYMARGHLANVWRKVWRNDPSVDDSIEPVPYRLAALGIVVGLLFMFGFCVAAGMSIGIVIPFIIIYLLISIAIARMRAELGPPAIEVVGMNSPNLLVTVLGARQVGTNNLTMFTEFFWMTGRGYRTHPMPHMLESMKMAEVARISARRLGVAIMLAVVLGALASYWTALHRCYQVGLANNNPLMGHNWEEFSHLEDWLRTPRKQLPDLPGTAMVFVGFIFTMWMFWMRTRFTGFPFHPAGYALAMNYGAEYFWSCILIAWLIKLVVLRFGGNRWYQKALPIAFGVILGEYTVGAFWSAFSVIKGGLIVYDFCPG
jgi:hypothetical protein